MKLKRFITTTLFVAIAALSLDLSRFSRERLWVDILFSVGFGIYIAFIFEFNFRSFKKSVTTE